MNTERPLIAITMGDAAGIGPEVIAKALKSESIYNICRPLVIGERAAMQKALQVSKNERVRKDAKETLDHAEQKLKEAKPKK